MQLKEFNYSEYMRYVRADIQRQIERKVSDRQLIKYIVKSLFIGKNDITFLCLFRLAKYKTPIRKHVLSRFHSVSEYLKIFIPVETEIGYGLNLGHAMCIVINRGTRIGNNCNIAQFVNIGTNHNTPATIGNNVYIGPMTCIVEDVCIGNNVTIGAGSVVTRNIPDNATAAGTPCRVLNYNNPGRYIKKEFVFLS